MSVAGAGSVCSDLLEVGRRSRTLVAIGREIWTPGRLWRSRGTTPVPRPPLPPSASRGSTVVLAPISVGVRCLRSLLLPEPVDPLRAFCSPTRVPDSALHIPRTLTRHITVRVQVQVSLTVSDNIRDVKYCMLWHLVRELAKSWCHYSTIFVWRGAKWVYLGECGV